MFHNWQGSQQFAMYLSLLPGNLDDRSLIKSEMTHATDAVYRKPEESKCIIYSLVLLKDFLQYSATDFLSEGFSWCCMYFMCIFQSS